MSLHNIFFSVKKLSLAVMAMALFFPVNGYAQSQINGEPSIVDLAQDGDASQNDAVPNLLDDEQLTTNAIISDGSLSASPPPVDALDVPEAGAVNMVPAASSPSAIPSTPIGLVTPEVPTVFYDANDIVPEEFRTQSNSVGGQSQPATQANPNDAPASKFISIKKDSEKGSQKSRLTAANRAVKLGRYESALSLYSDLYEKNPRDVRVLMGLATVQQKLGQVDSAISSYQQVIDLDSDNLSAQINMLGLMTDLYPSVALRRLMLLSKDHSQNPGIISQIGLAHARLASFSEAQKFFGMAAAMEPSNPKHFFNLGIVADKQSNFDRAIEYYEKALEIDSVYGNSRSVPREQIFERLAQLR